MELPQVFDVRRRPWVDVEAADAASIADAVEGCPTGALRYERIDGEAGEEPDSPTLIVPVPNGPLFLRGRLRIETPDGEPIAEGTRVALCRCGASANKPFCDNSHIATGFRTERDAAPPPGGRAAQPASEEGVTTVVVRDDASLRVRGDLRLVSLRGELLGESSELLLCRCGHSSTKPLCDGSHKRIGIHGTEPTIAPDREAAESPASFTPNAGLPRSG